MNMTLEQEFQARLEDSMHDILTVYYNVKYKREYVAEHKQDPALMVNIVTGIADEEVNDRVTNKLITLKCNKINKKSAKSTYFTCFWYGYNIIL